MSLCGLHTRLRFMNLCCSNMLHVVKQTNEQTYLIVKLCFTVQVIESNVLFNKLLFLRQYICVSESRTIHVLIALHCMSIFYCLTYRFVTQ